MTPFSTYEGIVFPLDRSNVDTDSIIPKQYLKSVKKIGFGANLFDDWRYLDPGHLGQDHSKRRLNPEFELNQPRYADAGILLARDNFGCGSSREHAVWALLEFGFRVVIAPSFSDIFYSNAIRNGLLAVVLPVDGVEVLFQRCQEQAAYTLKVDLPEQRVADNRDNWHFEMNKLHKRHLSEGLDQVDLILKHADKIRAYENKRMQETPWIFFNAGEGSR